MSATPAPKPPPLPRRGADLLRLPGRTGPPPLPGRAPPDLQAECEPDPDPRPLASRSARLVAAVLDLALSTGPAALLLIALIRAGSGLSGDLTPEQAMVRATREVGWIVGAIGAAVAWMLAVVVLQSVLVSLRGQTVGKVLARCRIVRLDGSPCGFWAGVVKRWWLLTTVGTVLSCVGLGVFVYLADYLAIFLDDRRCLHDHLGGTKVVEA